MRARRGLADGSCAAPRAAARSAAVLTGAWDAEDVALHAGEILAERLKQELSAAGVQRIRAELAGRAGTGYRYPYPLGRMSPRLRRAYALAARLLEEPGGPE